jgi:hypothetical protein
MKWPDDGKCRAGERQKASQSMRGDGPRGARYLWYDWWFPELNWIETRAEKRRVVGRAAASVWFLAGVCLTLPIALVIVLVTREWVVPCLAGGLSIPRDVASLFHASVIGSAASFGLLLLMRPRMQRDLRAVLASRGLPICSCCGYDLRGQTGTRCPECGSSFDASCWRATPPTSGESDAQESSSERAK